MLTAVVLLDVKRDRINAVAEELAELDGVSEVYSVTGRMDLIAMLRVKGQEDLAELVTNRILRVEGILRSETLLALRAYSRHDLEGMFTIGQ